MSVLRFEDGWYKIVGARGIGTGQVTFIVRRTLPDIGINIQIGPEARSSKRFIYDALKVWFTKPERITITRLTYGGKIPSKAKGRL